MHRCSVLEKLLSAESSDNLNCRVSLFAALLVRFLCHRFIGEYDPTIGKYTALYTSVEL